MDSKNLALSKTLIGVLVLILSFIVNKWGLPVEEGEVYEVATLIAGLIGAVLAVWGRFTAKKALTLGKAPKVLPVVLLALSLSLPACAMRDLTPPQKALAVGQELKLTFDVIVESYKDLLFAVDEDQSAAIRVAVEPHLLKAGWAVVALRDAATIWAETGRQPLDYMQLKVDAITALADAWNIYEAFKTKEVGENEQGDSGHPGPAARGAAAV